MQLILIWLAILVILLWARRKRIVTGADLLGRLLRGIARRQAA